MKKLLSRIFGKPTQQQLWNKYYTAKMKGDFTKVREVGNRLVMLRKSDQPTYGSYYYLMRKYSQAIIDKDFQNAKKYYDRLLEMDKALFRRS